MAVVSEAEAFEMSAGEAFSAGVGLSIGLVMSQHLLRTIVEPEVAARKVIICPKCAAKNIWTTNFVITADKVFTLLQKSNARTVFQKC